MVLKDLVTELVTIFSINLRILSNFGPSICFCYCLPGFSQHNVTWVLSLLVQVVNLLFLLVIFIVKFVLLSETVAKQAAPSKPTTDPTKYNVPEYFQHNNYSFYDLDIAMAKHRLPQPSKFDPLVPKKWQQPAFKRDFH